MLHTFIANRTEQGWICWDAANTLTTSIEMPGIRAEESPKRKISESGIILRSCNFSKKRKRIVQEEDRKRVDLCLTSRESCLWCSKDQPKKQEDTLLTTKTIKRSIALAKKAQPHMQSSPQQKTTSHKPPFSAPLLPISPKPAAKRSSSTCSNTNPPTYSHLLSQVARRRSTTSVP